MNYFLLCIFTFLISSINASEEQSTQSASMEVDISESSSSNNESDEIFWETSKYLSRLSTNWEDPIEDQENLYEAVE